MREGVEKIAIDTQIAMQEQDLEEEEEELSVQQRKQRLIVGFGPEKV
jgi:hypothetical protein